jgi:uncharacterized protein (DUF2235 family)
MSRPEPRTASGTTTNEGSADHPLAVEAKPTSKTRTELREEFATTRNLVLCLDGTSNQFSTTNTNVIKLFSVLDISPGYQQDGQMAYYDSGVGTYLPVGASSSWSEARQALGKGLDLAIAW